MPHRCTEAGIITKNSIASLNQRRSQENSVGIRNNVRDQEGKRRYITTIGIIKMIEVKYWTDNSLPSHLLRDGVAFIHKRFLECWGIYRTDVTYDCVLSRKNIIRTASARAFLTSGMILERNPCLFKLKYPEKEVTLIKLFTDLRGNLIKPNSTDYVEMCLRKIKELDNGPYRPGP